MIDGDKSAPGRPGPACFIWRLPAAAPAA